MQSDRDLNEQETATERREPTRARRPYVAPEVRPLGSVRDLTLGLSGSPMEGPFAGMKR